MIQSDFLDLIDVEVQVWGRNREHLVAFSDEGVRKQVRNFFTEISTHVVKARFHLQQFNQAHNASNAQEEESVKQTLQALAANQLSEAHKLSLPLPDVSLG